MKFINRNQIESLGRESVFPIFEKKDGILEYSATGFFVGSQGMFVTAKHVVTDKYGNFITPLYAAHINGKDVIIREILSSNVVMHPKSDIVIGGFPPMSKNGEELKNNSLEMVARKIDIGESITTFAYPKSKKIENSDTIIKIVPEFYGGIIEEYHPFRDLVLQPGESYRTDMLILSGASGGPVFDKSGRVVGVNSTSYGVPESAEEKPISYITPILELLGLEVPSQRYGKITIEELFQKSGVEIAKD